MSRLIDADKLIEDVLNSMPTGSARGVFRAFVDEQPTAFDVEKVVEQLEKESYYTDIETDREVVNLNEAIEIIKAGGIDE